MKCKPILNRVKCFTHDESSCFIEAPLLPWYYALQSDSEFYIKIFTVSLLQCLCCVYAQKISWTTNNTWIWQTSDSRRITQTISKLTQTILFPVKSTIKIVLNTATFLRARQNRHHHFLVLFECFILILWIWFYVIEKCLFTTVTSHSTICATFRFWCIVLWRFCFTTTQLEWVRWRYTVGGKSRRQGRVLPPQMPWPSKEKSREHSWLPFVDSLRVLYGKDQQIFLWNILAAASVYLHLPGTSVPNSDGRP